VALDHVAGDHQRFRSMHFFGRFCEFY